MTPTISTDNFAQPSEAPPERRKGEAPREDFVSLLFAAAPAQPVHPVAADAVDPQRETNAGTGTEFAAITDVRSDIGAAPPPDPVTENPPAGRIDRPDFRQMPPVPFPTELDKENSETKPRTGPILPGPESPTSSVPLPAFAVDAGRHEPAPDESTFGERRTAPPSADAMFVAFEGDVSGPIRAIAEARSTKPPIEAAVTERVWIAEHEKDGEAASVLARPTATSEEGLSWRKSSRPADVFPPTQVETSSNSGSIETLAIERFDGEPDEPGSVNETTNIADAILRKFGNELERKIETAKPSARTEIDPAKLIDQIAPRIAEIALPESGERRLLRMRLHPADLGSVEVELEKDPSGALTARIHAESPAAQHILVEGLDQLRDSLQSSGWTVGELQVDGGTGSSGGGEAGARDDRHRLADGTNFGEADTPPQTTQDAAPADGLVSLRA